MIVFSYPFRALVLAFSLTCAGLPLRAQQAAPAASAEMSDDDLLAGIASSLGPVAINPRQRGLSASVITSSQHDSITGWANIVTPQIAYRISRRFSVDAATPVFFYLPTTITATTATMPPTTTVTPVIKHGIAADTVLGTHFYAPVFSAPWLGSWVDRPSALLVLPSGSVNDGIGTGTVTYNVTNHLESVSRFAPYLDLGLGTISRVQNRRLQRDQTTRGLLANFSTGGRVRLPRWSEMSIEAYEQLPLSGTQRVSSTDPHGRGEQDNDQVLVSAPGMAEDNGFNSSLDIPLRSNLVLSGFYSRSLRQHADIGGFSFTYLLRRASR